MPVVAAYMVYAGATAVTTTAFAAFMAGTMVVGGAVSLVGTITGDKNLEKDGMMVGTIGSLGYGLAGGAKAAAGSETASSSTATASTAEPSLADKIASENMSLSSGAGTTAATAQSTNEAASLVAKFDALEKAQNMNMLGNVAQGVSTAYSSHEQKNMLQDQEEKRRADQQALIEERRKNMNLTGLSINTPKMPQIIKPGLINQPAQINPVTGSGQSMLKLK